MLALGMNARMPDLNAALGLSQLARCEANRKRRDYLASLYSRDLAGLGVVPYPAQDGTGAHHLFPIRIKNGKRDHVKAYLNERGIGAQVHYPSIHLQPYYRERFGWKAGDFPEAEAWADEELSLPLHAQMDEADVGRVVETLKEALN
jgi:dTDP-4-amino-4,6-dideoxygalactose transaminase